jgi:hypothetical protein
MARRKKSAPSSSTAREAAKAEYKKLAKVNRAQTKLMARLNRNVSSGRWR